jgi:hypothetical protein
MARAMENESISGTEGFGSIWPLEELVVDEMMQKGCVGKWCDAMETVLGGGQGR